MPFVLAFPVSKTDVPETDGPETDVPETDGPETDVPETEGAERKTETEEDQMDVPDDAGVFLEPSRRLQWLLLISFEWCEWVQLCVSLVDNSSGVWVGGWVVGWVCIGACAGAGGRKSMSSGRI